MPLPGTHTQKALKNSAWLLSERAITLLLTFLVGILLARYLGPARFGSLNFALAFVALLATIPYLGFGAVIVQELVRNPSRHGETMGIVVYSKFAAAVLAFVLANVIAHFAVRSSSDQLLILLVSFGMILDATLGFRLHFEAQTDSRPVVIVASTANIIGAVARIVAIVAAAPLWVFAALVSVQSAIGAVGYIAIYKRSTGRYSRLVFSKAQAQALFGKSWPLIISGAAATIYLKVDQFILGQVRGMVDVGTYAVAARLSEVTYVIPLAAVNSLFPRLVELRESDTSRYVKRLRESIRYLFWMGFVIALLVSVSAHLLVTSLFGPEYRAAGTILAIHIWACPAVFMGMAVEKWLVAEDLLKLFIGRQMAGAAINVILNLALVPSFGGVGSAVATVIAYTFAYYLSCFTSRKTALAGKWMTEAIVWPLLPRRLRQSGAGL